MNNNEYTIEDFRNEYDGFGYEKYIGLEFEYNNEWYRISREPNDNFKFYLINVKLIHKNKPPYPKNLKYEILFVCDNINELLEYEIIQNKPLKIILFSKESIILSQD